MSDHKEDAANLDNAARASCRVYGCGRSLLRAHALKSILLTLGVHDVEEAGDGDAALAKLKAPGAAFDLIFCDLQMPDRDGIETLRALAAWERALALSS